MLDEGMARWKCPRGYVENVASTIALAVMDDRAESRIYNVAESAAFTEAEWVRAIGQVVGWRGEIVTVPSGRIPLSYRVEQSIDIDSGRIRRELGYAEEVGSRDALERTVVWERAHPTGASQGIGLLNYDAEDILLADIAGGTQALSDPRPPNCFIEALTRHTVSRAPSCIPVARIVDEFRVEGGGGF